MSLVLGTLLPSKQKKLISAVRTGKKILNKESNEEIKQGTSALHTQNIFIKMLQNFADSHDLLYFNDRGKIHPCKSYKIKQSNILLRKNKYTCQWAWPEVKENIIKFNSKCVIFTEP